jgi:hypothetical protein
MAANQSALKKTTLPEVWASTRFAKSGNIELSFLLCILIETPAADKRRAQNRNERANLGLFWL